MIWNPLFIVGLSLFGATILWAIWYGGYVTRRLPPAGEIIDSPYGKLHIIRSGKPNPDLNPVVLLHGSMTNALDMELEIAPRLAQSREVLVVDRLGHGFSDRPEDGWRLDVQARAVRFVIKHVGFESPIVLGQSYGGALALRFALDFPDDLAALALIAPVTHRWPGGVAWYNRVAINPLYGAIFRYTFIALYGRFGSPRGAAKSLEGTTHQSSYHRRTRVALTFRPAKFYHNAEDIVRLYEQLFAMDTRYDEVSVPTEIVAGTHDMTVVTTVHGRSLERQIPDANMRVIDNGGHALHHSHPNETIDVIGRLDERLASAARSPLQGALRRLSQVFPSSATHA